MRSPVNLLRRPGIKCKNNRKMVSSDSDENEPKGI
jgi:hypothetical protein